MLVTVECLGQFATKIRPLGSTVASSNKHAPSSAVSLVVEHLQQTSRTADGINGLADISYKTLRGDSPPSWEKDKKLVMAPTK